MRKCRSLLWSNAPQPPSLFCIATSQAMPSRAPPPGAAIGIVHTLQGHQHKSRIVHIGVKVVAKLESPAARSHAGRFDLPIARAQHLMVQQPLRGATKPGDAAASPASSSATMAMAVSHTGDMHGCRRMVSASSISNRASWPISRAVSGSSGEWPSATSAKMAFIIAG